MSLSPLAPSEREALASDLLATLAATVAGRSDLVMETHALQHRCGRYDIARIASRDLASGPLVLVQAGLHGDEKAGPLTFARHLHDIVDYAHARGVKLIMFPLANPSGFDGNTRYNGDHDRGSAGNGDFLRYILADGSYADELPPAFAESALPWCWSSDVDVALPAETKLMQALLRREPLARIAAALDLHQDCLTPGLGPCSYAYAFGDMRRYQGITSAVRAWVPLLADRVIGAGFGVEIDGKGDAQRPQSSGAHPTSDADGFLVRHDGSLTDLFFRLGARHSVAVETSGATPIDVACAVNLLWIKGMIDLVSRRG